MSAVIPPAIRYLGSKFLCAEWIISHFPPHRAYCEPCGGGAAVLLNKPRAELETYNDIDGGIVNFFRVVRDHAPELTRRLSLSPWGREEFDAALEPSDDPIERARRLYVRLNMSINGTIRRTTGCRMCKNPDDRKKHTAALDDKLLRVAERLMGVQIEHRDALKVIQSYDTPDTLFYVDPPYLMETRKSGSGYAFETDRDWHAQMFAALSAIAGMAIVSGYPSALYRETYEAAGWRREDRQALTQRGMAIESLWISPRIQALPVQEVLFA